MSGRPDERFDELMTDAAAAMIGVDGKLSARAMHLVSAVEVGVADHGIRVIGCDEVTPALIAPVPKVQEHMLGERCHAVGFGDGRDEGEDFGGVMRVESLGDANARHRQAVEMVWVWGAFVWPAFVWPVSPASFASAASVASSARWGTNR